jgi:hypothetical protein
VVTAGETIKEAPVPTCVPPQLPVYQIQLGAELSVPPLTCKVVDWPADIVVELAVALVGETGAVQTFIVTDLQVVLVPQAVA